MAKVGLQFDGFADVLENLKRLEADIKKPVEEALNVSADIVTAQLDIEIKKHHVTGRTEKSLRDNPKVIWSGNKAEVEYGFSIKDGGLASIFLERGTPKQKPTPVIKPAISKTKKKVKEKQEQILLNALREAGSDGS